MPATELLAAPLIFAFIAIFAPNFLRAFAKRRRLRAPHSALLLIFRLWFALLAIGSLIILFHR
jgi:hypothetical protein